MQTPLASPITQTQLLVTTIIDTPLGAMIAAATDDGIAYLGFADQKNLRTDLASINKTLNATQQPGSHPHLTLLEAQLDDYFAGKRTSFTVPLVMTGTEFQKQVWRALLEIPSGKTASYQEQAARLGKPEAIRAVAQANGRNRICILVPCHRVIGSNGSLTGYSAGLERKQWLLNHEVTG